MTHTTIDNCTTIDDLQGVYDTFLKVNNYDSLSADDLLYELMIDEENDTIKVNKSFLIAFIDRWLTLQD